MDSLKMDSMKSTRILGLAFTFQFITSFSNGVFIKSLWFITDDIKQTLLNLPTNIGFFRLWVFIDILTGLGVVFLGAALYITLKSINRYLSTTAFAFYIMEGTLLVASKIEAYKLFLYSQDFVANKSSIDLVLMAEYSYQSMDFVGNTLHMVTFSFGAVLFYYLLTKYKRISKWISYWGLISLIPIFIGSVIKLFNFSIPIVFYVPYIPFELFIGIWIMIKGVPRE